jgi:hypothetical protein
LIARTNEVVTEMVIAMAIGATAPTKARSHPSSSTSRAR